MLCSKLIIILDKDISKCRLSTDLTGNVMSRQRKAAITHLKLIGRQMNSDLLERVICKKTSCQHFKQQQLE